MKSSHYYSLQFICVLSEAGQERLFVGSARPHVAIPELCVHGHELLDWRVVGGREPLCTSQVLHHATGPVAVLDVSFDPVWQRSDWSVDLE